VATLASKADSADTHGHTGQPRHVVEFAPFRGYATAAAPDLLHPEEVLDLVLHSSYVQSKDIQLVEWNLLLHRRMNVPRIVSVTHFPSPL